MKKTTAKQARDIAYQVTESVMKNTGGQISETWNENPTVWWQNIYSKANLTNEYFQTLVDTFIYMRIQANDFENPLAQYKSGDLPLGFGETEIYINPQTGRYFAINPEETVSGDVYYPGYGYTTKVTNGSGANSSGLATTILDGVGETNASINRNQHIMLDKVPDIKQIFFRVNYGRQYQRTYAGSEILKTVETWENYAQFIDGIARDINASLQIDEYNAMRDLFTKAMEVGIIPIYPLTALANESDAKTLLQYARQFNTNFQFPSKNFSAWNVMNPGDEITTWSKPENISILLTAQTTSVVDVQALASAFNLEYSNFIGKRTQVDFIDSNNKVKAIMFDDFAINCKDVLDQTGEFYNTAGAKLNVFRNKQSIMALNPFANMVAFTTNTFTSVTGDSAPADWATATGKYYQKSAAGTYTAINGANVTYVSGSFYVIG